MSSVQFFEKPGCINNTRQKQILRDAGVTFEAHNLLKEPWTPSRLRAFFGDMPLPAWFNPSAPRMKSGEVLPETLSEQQALEAMVADPLLIRRPLIERGDFRCAGFDWPTLSRALGVNEAGPNRPLGDVESCPRSASDSPGCKTEDSA